MKRSCGAVFLSFAVCGFSVASPVTPKGWKTYTEEWFNASYPEAFSLVPVQKSRSGDGFDSVSFVAPSKDIEFYVYTPQSGGEASVLEIDAAKERVTSRKMVVSDYRGGGGAFIKDAVEDTWLGISANDGSYVRFVHQRNNVEGLHKTIVFAVKCKDMAAYARYKKDYDSFRKSLVQYGH
jgi:hypothetical protein